MKLFFAFAQRSLRIGGVPLLDQYLSECNLGICSGFFLASLVSARQRFFVRLARGGKVATIHQQISLPVEDGSNGALVITFQGSCLSLSIESCCDLQVPLLSL